jgi:hypothetical protein
LLFSRDAYIVSDEETETLKRQIKVVKEVKLPRRMVTESEALEFIQNVDQWRKKKLTEWRKTGRVPTPKPTTE